MASNPLTGLTIVVTRPRDQAVQLVQRIEQAGGIPFLFPLLDIAAVQDTKTLYEQIARLAQFDLAIFISPNAVRYGVEAIRAASESPLPPCKGGERSEGAIGMAAMTRRCEASGAGMAASHPLPQSAGFASNVSRDVGVEQWRSVASTPSLALPLQGGGKLKVATVGQGSAQALRESGISHVIAPTQRFDSEGLLALPELQNVAGWRVMIFRGDGGRELLGDTLKARGAAVEYATCYLRSKPQQDVQLLLDVKPDAITVTSSEALGYLGQMLDSKGKNVLRDTPLFVPHDRIAGLAKQQGWQHVHLTGSGDDGLISALIAWAGQRAEDREQKTEG